MKKGRAIASLFTIIFVFLAAGLFILESKMTGEEGLRFGISSAGHVEVVRCWEDENDKLYVFLPSYTALENIILTIDDESGLYIDDVEIKDGMLCDSFELNREYRLTGILHGDHVDQKLEFVQSGNVPAMFIDTQSGSMEHIHQEKGNEEPGSMRLYETSGEQVYSGELESLKGRGNTTWNESKKPYNVRLLFEGDLLQMGKAQNWVLLANAKDSTNLLNKIALDFARDIGMKYTPECQWVDLYLNGEYAGLYLLTERIEAHSERVDILKEDGFLVSKEVQSRLEGQGYPHIVTQNNMALRIHHSSVSESDLKHIWQQAVDAVLQDKDWQSVIDTDSWAMRMLVDEIFGNGDGGIASQFYYGNLSEGKIYAGPVWDMDLCLAQTGWPGGYRNAIIAYRQQLNWVEEPLYGKLYQYPEFHDRLAQLYHTIFLPAVSELLDETYMNDANRIAQAAFLNEVRWNSGSFEEAVQKNYSFLKDRIAFINEYWAEEESYHLVHIEPGYYGVWGCFAVKDGDCIPAVYGDDTDGWVVLGTEEPFDITQPVYEDVTIYHRENFNALRSRIEAEMNPQNVVSDDENEVGMQKKAPVLVLTMLMVGMTAWDILRRKSERNCGRE